MSTSSLQNGNSAGRADMPSEAALLNEPMSIDEIIDAALDVCRGLPQSCSVYTSQIQELRSRLGKGRLQLAVLGQFNRGKSTFINALIGLKVLPTSVLPITSVPTIISYNALVTCTVRFLSKKPDLVVRQSLDSIAATLLKYVAEENNPKNQLCVKEVEVTCPSRLLENGTVLIDTPGFGSTHLHNTRTALDVLGECDAAVFLLSADPPMTQTEVEFLKQVKPVVPRIFFILNKVDLLTEQQLEKVDRFIKEILVGHLDYSADFELFHICAAKGEKAASHNPFDRNWSESGIEKVKTEILDFMVRDKYFTLSRALNDKLCESIDGIREALTTEVNNYKMPVELLVKERDELSSQVETIRKNMEKELKLIEIEKKAVLQFLQEQTGSKRQYVKLRIMEALDSLLAKSSGKRENADWIRTALQRTIRDAFAHLLVVVISNVNKPLRKAVLVHEREFIVITDAASKCVDTASLESSSLHEKLDKMELDLSTSWTCNVPESALKADYTWTDHFRSRGSKNQRFRLKFDISLDEVLKTNFDSLTAHIQYTIEDFFLKIFTTLSHDYKELSVRLEDTIAKKDDAVKQRTLEHGNNIESIHKIMESLAGIKAKLRP